MPDIGVFHPQIVHFVIALLVAGVIFRLISLTGRFRFTSPAATTLIVAGTLAAVVAVKSGDDAHGPAERIPGARDAVENHEEWGQRTRNLFLAIATLEIIVLLLGTQGEKRQQVTKGAAIVSGGLGLIGLFFLYETGEHGGEIVYEYAGGVGTRSGDPEDVENLLIAGLYNNAIKDRAAGKGEDAARLIAELERRRPNDPEIRVLAIESLLLDRKDPNAAVAALRGFAAGDNEALVRRVGLLKVDAFAAAAQLDSARAVMAQLQQAFPDHQLIRDRAAQLQAGK
ncbi:MAG: DUF2231 domain-containing protein [Gemmatimonadota bacterium]